MDNGLNLQEKVDDLKRQILGGSGLKQVYPVRTIFCIFWGILKDPEHQVCRQLCWNMKQRYRMKHAFHCSYGSSMSHDMLRSHLEKIWNNVNLGMFSGMNQYYIPIVFMMDDERIADLPEYVEWLRGCLQKEGIHRFQIDLYGLLDYSKPNVKKQWDEISETIFHMLQSYDELGDLYILSRDTVGSSHAFSRALAAIEANIYLKTCEYQELLEGIWQRPGSLLGTERADTWWKVLSYWKADFLEYLICRMYDEVLEWQWQGKTNDYRELLDKLAEQFWMENDWLHQFSDSCIRLPVRASDMEKAMPDTEKIFLFPGRVKRYRTNREILLQLYGNEEFLLRYGNEIKEKKENAAGLLLDRLLRVGTLRDVEQEMIPFLEQHKAGWIEQEGYFRRQIILCEGQSAAYGSKTYSQFLSRFYQDYVSLYQQCAVCRWKQEIVEMALERYQSRQFQESLKGGERRLEESHIGLVRLMNENIICRSLRIQALFKQEIFFPDKDKYLCWKDNILQMNLELLKQKSGRDMKEILRYFVKGEGNDLMAAFMEEIQRAKNDDRDFSHYVLYGNSNSLRHTIREVMIMGNKFVKKLMPYDTVGMERFFDKLPEQDFMTWEYVAVNDSNCLSGIYGLNAELG